MFNVYHYHHWSSGHAVVVATSQVLAGGYTQADEESASKAFVPVSSKKTIEDAIAEARRYAAAIIPRFTEYQSGLDTVDGSRVLFGLKK